MGNSSKNSRWHIFVSSKKKKKDGISLSIQATGMPQTLRTQDRVRVKNKPDPLHLQ